MSSTKKTALQVALTRQAAKYSSAQLEQMARQTMKAMGGNAADTECLLWALRIWIASDWREASGRKGLKANTPDVLQRYIQATARAIVKGGSPSNRNLTVKRDENDLVLNTVIGYAINEGFIRHDDYASITKLGRTIATYQGALLEEYIYKQAKPYGLIWLKAETVKATDFVFSDNGERLQVKMRYNTENSSSSEARKMHDVPKWYCLKNGTDRFEELRQLIQRHTTKRVPKNLFSIRKFNQFCIETMTKMMVLENGLTLLLEVEELAA